MLAVTNMATVRGFDVISDSFNIVEIKHQN